ncbi:MAG: 4-alpha-glucanotransferase [Oscillospiraceae bacterium]|nr:4-alpha-glucanotransferase [Oscillospiraceae bacterium]
MRECGILLPVSSLPSKYGIGCFDQAAFHFIDQLAAAGQHVWQILPIGPTGYGDSPYQSFSTFAGSPYYISLDDLIQRGWLTREECDAAYPGSDPRYVDYGALYQWRFPLLRKAYERSNIAADPDFQAFKEKHAYWLEDYTLFMAIKDANNGAGWSSWGEPLRMRDPEALKAAADLYRDDIQYYAFLQYCFFTQWQQVMDYAHSKNIRILGDTPIYVALDSADTWSNPELFQLDEYNRPTDVSGCPPDAFAADGQLWGNPLYRWDYHAETGFAWWISRIRHTFTMCDILRIDHFRGFDEYFSIPGQDTTARNGHWEKGPGIALFKAIEQALGKKEIVAEDLGYVTDSVRQLVTDTGFPGMKVFEFAFDSRDTGSAADYLPHNYIPNSVAYTGTHDNATVTGWLDEITDTERDMVHRYIASDVRKELLYWPIACAVLRSVSKLAIVPIQDYMGYGNEARINKPSTSGTNWKWRLLEGEFSDVLIQKIHDAAVLYGRA